MPELHNLFPTTETLPLLTDLYELTMAAGYFCNGRHERAAFEAYIRSLPADRSFMIAAGLEQALDYILNLRFSRDTLTWLRSLPQFQNLPADFFDYLGDLRFAGDVWAIPEGTVVFANEPLIRIEADIIEAQILETYLLTCLNLQTLVATKAAHDQPGRPGPARRRLRHSPGPRPAGGPPRRPRQHHRRLHRHQQRPSRPRARRSRCRHHGPLLGHGLRRRGQWLCRLRRRLP